MNVFVKNKMYLAVRLPFRINKTPEIANAILSFKRKKTVICWIQNFMGNLNVMSNLEVLVYMNLLVHTYLTIK